MDIPPWYTFLLNNPEAPIPFPWERRYDVQNQTLHYRNVIDGTVIFDLRPIVNVGGSMFYVNDYWDELRRAYSFNNINSPLLHRQMNHNGDYLVLVPATCCGPNVYLILPEPVFQCPFCYALLRRIIIAYTSDSD
ncbi:hypothetical protein Pint_02545 [Pistacia integerrima]|uniref:Uncharacterized protein n=1 Tax=Pistacia integerrima TaxID=434235 RepID=A0ACC0ZKX8_9ROSI|nr:hypothetical protein Pint_02545 [Pistacia integerrima]